MSKGLSQFVRESRVYLMERMQRRREAMLRNVRQLCCDRCDASDVDLVRLPGLFRRWEISEVVEVGVDFHIEEAGLTQDGTPLFAIYRREPTDSDGEA